MSALELLIKLIKESEGCKLKAYKDCIGVVTIGWGQTKGIKEGMVWTQNQADEDLIKTALEVLNQAIKASPILATVNMEKQAAIADFVYNLGIGSYTSSTLKKKVDANDWISAAVEIKRWDKAGGKVLKGLTIRRNKEAELILS
jgi:lysozyme